MVVGTMIVHPQKYGEDTEVVNQFTHTNTGNLKRGNTIGGHNGNRYERVKVESGSSAETG